MSDWKTADLPVAIYVNQRIDFDLLATFEDGLMQVRTLTTQSGGETGATEAIEASASAGGILKLFSLGIKGSTNKASKNSKAAHEAGVATTRPVPRDGV